jgi:hypothetical protein
VGREPPGPKLAGLTLPSTATPTNFTWRAMTGTRNAAGDAHRRVGATLDAAGTPEAAGASGETGCRRRARLAGLDPRMR